MPYIIATKKRILDKTGVTISGLDNRCTAYKDISSNKDLVVSTTANNRLVRLDNIKKYVPPYDITISNLRGSGSYTSCYATCQIITDDPNGWRWINTSDKNYTDTGTPTSGKSGDTLTFRSSKIGTGMNRFSYVIRVKTTTGVEAIGKISVS